MAVGRRHGDNNQEGRLTPQVSVWGQELAQSESHLIEQERPIGRQSRGFRGNVGAMVTYSASVTPLMVPGGYWGDLPVTEQPVVSAPDPWNRV